MSINAAPDSKTQLWSLLLGILIIYKEVEFFYWYKSKLDWCLILHSGYSRWIQRLQIAIMWAI